MWRQENTESARRPGRLWSRAGAWTPGTYYKPWRQSSMAWAGAPMSPLLHLQAFLCTKACPHFLRPDLRLHKPISSTKVLKWSARANRIHKKVICKVRIDYHSWQVLCLGVGVCHNGYLVDFIPLCTRSQGPTLETGHSSTNCFLRALVKWSKDSVFGENLHLICLGGICNVRIQISS